MRNTIETEQNKLERKLTERYILTKRERKQIDWEREWIVIKYPANG